MALAPNRSRAKRTRFSSFADQLYPEDDTQEPVTEGPEEDAGDEQDGADEADPVRPMSQKEMADKVYPDEQDQDESGQEDDEPDGADQEADGDSEDDASGDAERQGKTDGSKDAEKNSSQKKAEPKIINSTRSEPYDTYVKIGGSRAWRNNNPGNIEYRKQPEATGVEKAGRFAKFPTEAAGMAALKKFLGTTYKDWNVKDLMTKKYAPPGGKDKNNPEAYVEFLGKHGVDLKKPVGQQVDVMAEAIKQQEGWIPGTITDKK